MNIKFRKLRTALQAGWLLGQLQGSAVGLVCGCYQEHPRAPQGLSSGPFNLAGGLAKLWNIGERSGE